MSQSLNYLTKIFYSIGQISFEVKNGLFHYFFILFFSTVMGLSGTLVGAAVLIALIVDALTDPIMGGISDEWRSKLWGRRHLFMLLSAIPTGLGLWFIFSPPLSLSNTNLFIWMLGFTILVRLGLTLFYVPYLALNAELTESYDERTQISSLRTIFGELFKIFLITLFFTVFLVDPNPEIDGRMNPAAYSQMGQISAICAIISILISTLGTFNQVPRLERKTQSSRSVKWWKGYTEIISALQIKAFRTLCLGFIFFTIMAGITTALALYFMSYFWEFTQEQSMYILIAMGLAVIPGAILTPIIQKIFDKKGGAIIALIFYALIYCTPIMLRLLGLMPENHTSDLFYLMLMFYFSGQIFVMIGLILSESMMADVTDEYELETENRQEGLLYSATMFARKASFGIGGFFAGIILDIVRFPVKTDPGEVDLAILWNLGVAVIPVVLLLQLTSAFFFKTYPITRSIHEKTITSLNK